MDYLDFSEPTQFLEAALLRLKPKPSIRKLSKELGFSSDRTIGMILNKRRPMSQTVEIRLAKHLKLNNSERLHLNALAIRSRGVEVQLEAKPKNWKATERRLQGEELHPLIPNYALAVVDILWLAGKSLSAQEIQQRLREFVELPELQLTLLNLVRGGFLKDEDSRHFRALRDDEFVGTSNDIPSEAIRMIHRQQLERAIRALSAESVLDREFVAKTLVVSKSKVESIKRLLRQKLEEVAEEVQLQKPENDAAVAQLNLQFYLQSK